MLGGGLATLLSFGLLLLMMLDDGLSATSLTARLERPSLIASRCYDSDRFSEGELLVFDVSLRCFGFFAAFSVDELVLVGLIVWLII